MTSDRQVDYLSYYAVACRTLIETEPRQKLPVQKDA